MPPELCSLLRVIAYDFSNDLPPPHSGEFITIMQVGEEKGIVIGWFDHEIREWLATQIKGQVETYTQLLRCNPFVKRGPQLLDKTNQQELLLVGENETQNKNTLT